MTPNKNIRRETEPAEPRKYTGAAGKKVGTAFKKVLGGEIIGTGTFRFFPFLVFVAFLAFVYIANNYLAEDKIRKINRLTKELKEIRYEFITTKSKLGELTKQSKLADKLESKGIRESTEPIKTIKAVQDKDNE